MLNNLELLDIYPFIDDRGQLKKILMKSMLKEGQEIQEVYVLFSNKDTVRGNHYHEKTIEYFTVISGEALIVLADKALKEFEYISVRSEDNITIKADPNIVHAIKNESDEPLVVLAVSLKEYSTVDTDTYPVIII